MWPFRRNESAGARGERLACGFLRRAGLKILARNYRCPAGVAEIIALDRTAPGGPAIAVVEVKTRSDDRYVDPESAVDAAKRRQLRGVAQYYLAHHASPDHAARFDVVAVLLKDGQEPSIRHIVDAF
jgi:putative endonuclease